MSGDHHAKRSPKRGHETAHGRGYAFTGPSPRRVSGQSSLRVAEDYAYCWPTVWAWSRAADHEIPGALRPAVIVSAPRLSVTVGTTSISPCSKPLAWMVACVFRGTTCDTEHAPANQTHLEKDHDHHRSTTGLHHQHADGAARHQHHSDVVDGCGSSRSFGAPWNADGACAAGVHHLESGDALRRAGSDLAQP